jgi:hypothetical protein
MTVITADVGSVVSDDTVQYEPIISPRHKQDLQNTVKLKLD